MGRTRTDKEVQVQEITEQLGQAKGVVLPITRVSASIG